MCETRSDPVSYRESGVQLHCILTNGILCYAWCTANQREKLQDGTGKYTVASHVQHKQTGTQETCTHVAETWVGWKTFISVSIRDVFICTHSIVSSRDEIAAVVADERSCN